MNPLAILVAGWLGFWFVGAVMYVLDLPHWMLIAAVTVISFLYSGYSPVFNNNIYHIPLLLESYDLPQFSGDAFIQSLRHFSSGFWILFAGAGQVVGVKLFLTDDAIFEVGPEFF